MHVTASNSASFETAPRVARAALALRTPLGLALLAANAR